MWKIQETNKQTSSAGVSYLVVTVAETKGSRATLIILRIITVVVLVLALAFHYLVGMKRYNMVGAVNRNAVPFPGFGK